MKIKFTVLNTLASACMLVASVATFIAGEYTDSMILASLACINTMVKIKEEN